MLKVEIWTFAGERLHWTDVSQEDCDKWEARVLEGTGVVGHLAGDSATETLTLVPVRAIARMTIRTERGDR